MANLKITELPTGSNYMSSSWQEGIEGGLNVKFDPSQTNPFRGTWAGTTAFPSTGGRYTAGAPAAGDEWVTTDTLVVGGNVYGPGTILKALVNGAGATTLTDWAKYSMQL